MNQNQIDRLYKAAMTSSERQSALDSLLKRKQENELNIKLRNRRGFTDDDVKSMEAANRELNNARERLFRTPADDLKPATQLTIPKSKGQIEFDRRVLAKTNPELKITLGGSPIEPDPSPISQEAHNQLIAKGESDYNEFKNSEGVIGSLGFLPPQSNQQTTQQSNPQYSSESNNDEAIDLWWQKKEEEDKEERAKWNREHPPTERKVRALTEAESHAGDAEKRFVRNAAIGTGAGLLAAGAGFGLYKYLTKKKKKPVIDQNQLEYNT